MALNYIWIGFFIAGFAVALVHFLISGDIDIFKKIIDGIFSSSKTAVTDVALPLTGIMTLWLGLMNIGEKAGAVNFLSRIVGSFFRKLFPDVPRNHPASGQLLMNFSANMLGLGNAATPLGLKAMNSLQELNPNKDTASNAQIMFLVLNTSSLTIIPASILAQRAILGSANPTDVFVPILIATGVSTLTGLIYVSIKQKINLFDKTVLLWLGSMATFIAGLTILFAGLSREQVDAASSFAGNFILLSIIISFLLGAAIKRINAYDAFIEGAKDGFAVTIKIIPYLVAMLTGIAVFRASGALGYIVDGMAWCIKLSGSDVEFVSALPVAFMKPLSGSGSTAMMIETMKTYGADSLPGRLSCIFQGAADTTFYIVALYFGSAGIRKTRYAIQGGLIADAAGVMAAIAVCHIFFG